eukprot:m.60232 g.60232  ORF g.60232 m.60232 type:complete len:336 (+) comp13846_c0_seq1:252-1259(+)
MSATSLPPALAAKLAKRGVLKLGKKKRFDPYEDDLPLGWHAVIEVASGDVYFWNTVTQHTQWTVPTKPAAATAVSLHNHAMMAQHEARRMAQQQLAQQHPQSGLAPPAGLPPPAGPGSNPNLQPLGGGAQPPPSTDPSDGSDPAPKRPKPNDPNMDPEFAGRLAALRGGGGPPQPPLQAQALTPGGLVLNKQEKCWKCGKKGVLPDGTCPACASKLGRLPPPNMGMPPQYPIQHPPPHGGFPPPPAYQQAMQGFRPPHPGHGHPPPGHAMRQAMQHAPMHPNQRLPAHHQQHQGMQQQQRVPQRMPPQEKARLQRRGQEPSNDPMDPNADIYNGP